MDQALPPPLSSRGRCRELEEELQQRLGGDDVGALGGAQKPHKYKDNGMVHSMVYDSLVHLQYGIV